MTVTLAHVGTTAVQNFEFALTSGTVTVRQDNEFVVADFSTGVSRVIGVGPTGPVLIDEWWHGAGPRSEVDVIGAPGSLPTLLLQDLQAASDAGLRSASSAFLAPGGLFHDAAKVLVAPISDQTLFLAASERGTGLSIFRIRPDNTFEHLQSVTDTSQTFLRDISDLALLDIATVPHLIAASSSEDGISILRLPDSGGLDVVASIGRDDSLPVQTITALAPIEIADRSFVIVAAAGSSSLTVLDVTTPSNPTVVDHVIDDLTTRFEGITTLEIVQHADHVFVLTAGRDAGLSLFRLMPEGWLIHLDTLADGLDFALDGVSGLAAQIRDNGLDILVTAAGEAGLSLFRADLGTPGLVLLGSESAVMGGAEDDVVSLIGPSGRAQGRSGDDVLADGTGSDTLIGGPGSDRFILRADGQSDVIADFTLGKDLLDLSLWPFLRNPGQIAFAPGPQGAILRFGDEEVDLRNAADAPFEDSDRSKILGPIFAHFNVTLGALEIADPAPPPDVLQPPAGPLSPSPPAPAPDGATGLTLLGSGSADLLVGGAADDILSGRDGDDTLRGDAGDDMLAGVAGDDLVEGGEGNDNIGGGPGNDSLLGQTGNDTLGGGRGDDTLSGGTGRDVMSGGPGRDQVDGGADDDTLAGSFDADTVRGAAGGDDIGGGPSGDLIFGDAGNDSIGGGEGSDTINGGNGDDFLAGGGRNDMIDAGPGRDRINPGNGDDTVTGGAAADMFIFNELNDGERDVITDFQVGTDAIRLSGIEGQTRVDRFEALEIVQTAEGALVHHAGHVIQLRDVAPDDLIPDDFIFL